MIGQPTSQATEFVKVSYDNRYFLLLLKVVGTYFYVQSIKSLESVIKKYSLFDSVVR